MLEADEKLPLQSERDLHKLLTEWKLETILPHLTAEKVDVNVLKMMKVSHIRLLLNNFPIGIQIRFEYNLEQWRNDIGKPLKFYIYDDINQIILKQSAQNIKELTNIKENTNKDSNGSTSNNITKTPQKLLTVQNDETSTLDAPVKSTTFIQTTKSPYTVNLHKILLHSQPDGSVILDAYQRNNKLSHPERRLLINTIVNYYLESGKEFNLQTSYDLEFAILEMFPNERLAMYRIAKQGKLYLRYLAAKEGGNKQKRLPDRMDFGDVNLASSYDSSLEYDDHYTKNSSKPIVTNMADQNEDSMADLDDYSEESKVVKSSTEIDDFLLQTLYNGHKKFVKIVKPFKYNDFLSAACRVFNISNFNDHYVAVNECEISESDFKNVVLQYYKLSTFTVELKEKSNNMPEILVPKVEQIESSCSPTTSFPQQAPFINTPMDNSSVQIIYNHLPDANDIRNLPSLLPIVKMADNGKTLENKHRNHIAKAIIDECLNFQPERILKRQDFFTLTDNLVSAFPNEVASAYFIPSQPNHAARGKLWNAYNNKRNFFGRSGIVQRRPINNKRKCTSDQEEDSEKTSDKVFITEKPLEIEDFSQNSTLDWNTLKQKWSDCHQERRYELVKLKISPQDYMTKYSILQGVLGIDLMEIDVNILYPTVANVNNWLSLYEKVIEKARLMRKYDLIARILDAVDNSNDEKYRASLTLILISYIFPYNARRNDTNGEKASKSEIQERFVKEYGSMEDLKSDVNRAELQIRFVHQSQQIEYAEFTIGGFTFKCIDLLEALSSIFHYIMAMNIEYPQMCLHIWQFVQLAIFQIEIQDYKLPNVDSTINDLYMN